MDRSLQPGNDFYRYANGRWLAKTEIPSDQTSIGTLAKAGNDTRERVRAILEKSNQGSRARLGAFYESYMAESTVNRKGATPILPWLKAIENVHDKANLAKEMAKLQQADVTGLFNSAIYPDDKNPALNAVHLSQSGIGMPGRDYYIQSDSKMISLRNAYVKYLTRLLTLVGVPDGDSRSHAAMTFETRLAEAQWDAVARRDANATYNVWSFTDFSRRAPGLSWSLYLQTLGLSRTGTYIVGEPTAIKEEARIWKDTPLPVLKDWLMLRCLDRYARYLSEPFVAANFAYSGQALNGVSEIASRWVRGVRLITSELKDEVGAAYVEAYFPEASKVAVEAMAANIKTAFARRLQAEVWMSPDTKLKAQEKLAAVRIEIGYPEKWRIDDGLIIRRDDLFGNVVRAEIFGYQANLAKAGRPVDRGSDWDIPATSAGGEAKPSENVLIIPAGLLQAPVYDIAADPAVNYGAIGIIIGHEFSHFFDDQGRRYDAHGRLSDWWSSGDEARFLSLTAKLVAQYSKYEPIPGVHVNGQLTLGENIADLAGVLVSHDAYILALRGLPAPMLDGFSGDQRFFLGQAQLLREKSRDDALRNSLLNDPHCPGEQRVLTDRNIDAWYTAFNVTKGQELYLATEDRVHIW